MVREGPPVARGGMGGPSKRQLGPDPHLGALDFQAEKAARFDST